MDQEENPTLNLTVKRDSKLKELVVEYIGETLEPENEDITVDMAVEVFAKEFPEFLMAVAEENFIRGYNQAFLDIEAHEKQINNAKRPVLYKNEQ